MIFEKIEYLIYALIITILFIFFRMRFYSLFFERVKKFWFYDVTVSRKLSNFIYALAFIVLAVAIGDLRGKEEMIEANIPTQKTLVVIDNSLSMMVEDIRPNRIKKALLLARHFVRNSYGHQVSLAVFSDLFKQIVPFTDDIEILEARLQVLNDAQSQGGSNIGMTLKEAVQYFQTKSGYEKGNILLFTDGEEHGDTSFSLPEEITLAVVAVGSENGGKIPLRSKDGNFLRYKKHNNEEVISKLDIKFFQSLEKAGANVKIWFSQSYSLPTEEIIGFFTSVHEQSFQKGSFRQRPVKGIPLILLFVSLYIASVIISRFKTFKFIALFAILMISFENESKAQEESEINTNPEMLEYLEKLKSGEISKDEKLKLAEILLQSNENEKSSALYREVIKNLDKEKVEDVFNFGTSLLKEGKISDAMSLYKYLDKEREVPKEMSEIIKKNLQLALKEQESSKEQESESDSQKESEDKKDSKDSKGQKKKKSKGSKSSKSKDEDGDEKSPSSDSEKGDKENKDQSEDQKNKEKSNEDKDGSDKQEKKDDAGEEKDDKDSLDKNKDGKSFEEIKKEIELKKKNGVKGVLRQIMNDDANLQKEFINSSSKQNGSQLKDW